MLTLAVFLPIVCGVLMLLRGFVTRRAREIVVEGVTLITSLLVFICLFNGQGELHTAFYLTDSLPIAFRLDGVGSVFTGIVALLWPLATLYAFEYMRHEGGENHFFALYTITFGVTLGISTAANAITLYLFYEFLTLCTMPLVMHGTSDEAVSAGHKYMVYSFTGAALAFVGVMIVICYGEGGMFAMGGAITAQAAAAHPLAMQIGYLCCFLGFGVKAAVFPLHAWLPTASVAPTPVTALLHAVAVVKSGVFAIIRMTFFAFGTQYLRGTPVQNLAIVMASVTIIFGSTFAVKEHHFKRRLAYSTISNLSYIVLATVLMTPAGLAAGLAHMIFHALIKITLFFCAGAVLCKTGKSQIESLRGFSRPMPFISAVYTLGAIALMGTPLLPGFVSKWMIGSAVLESGSPLAVLGMFAILVSAVLTAMYLMATSFFMYFRPLNADSGLQEGKCYDPGLCMKLPLTILCVLIVACGLFSGQITGALTAIAAGVL